VGPGRFAIGALAGAAIASSTTLLFKSIGLTIFTPIGAVPPNLFRAIPRPAEMA
jgi:hypothetical protein